MHIAFFTRDFNILASNPTIIQEFFHFCFPFLNFLIQVIIFYIDVWTFFKLTSKNLAHIGIIISKNKIPQMD
jgi:hypothetical protein